MARYDYGIADEASASTAIAESFQTNYFCDLYQTTQGSKAAFQEIKRYGRVKVSVIQLATATNYWTLNLLADSTNSAATLVRVAAAARP